jgi:NitT/TauT family transport system permease protein
MSFRVLSILAALLMLSSLLAPVGESGWSGAAGALACAVVAAAGAVAGFWQWSVAVDRAIGTTALLAGALAPLLLLSGPGPFGTAAPGIWLFAAGWILLLWRVLSQYSRLPLRGAGALIAPGLFGVALLYLWQVLVIGFDVPKVLLPSPSQVGQILGTRLDILWPDFRQTFLKAVLAGYAIGCAAGFLVAVIADRIPFLKRGLLPLSGLVSAVPIVGIAPILVMWFGFDWQSKAAVVVVVTFFPMLVNMLAGLAAADDMQRDLMHSYAASYGQTLIKLRLPAALPFVFNALKINSTLALIGAIVAEFFGTPTLGIGFRISTEVGRMALDMVWAEIALSAIAGMAFYGAVALAERATTFWHPSFRSSLG